MRSGSHALVSMLLLVASMIPCPGTASAIETMPIEEVEAGQRGYGVSVFSGDRPERFEIEVLGVMRAVAPGMSYVLARLSGQGLERSGVVSGMSGSPVYIDDRLVGAIAFSWTFAEEAIAGITPIEAMRGMTGSRRPRGAATTRVELSDLVSGQDVLDDSELRRHLSRLAPSLPTGARSAVGWAATDIGGGFRELLSEPLGPLSPAGATAAPRQTTGELRAGDAVAAVLVNGDLRLAATGTVTDVDGESVLAFGHPFLGLGELAIPMARAEVVTVIPNQVSSFKVVNLGPSIGAFEEDRLAGIRGRLGATAPTIPLTVQVAGAEGDERYEMELARVRQITPLLFAVSVLGAQEAAAQSAGAIGLDMKARFDLGSYGPLEVEQSFDGESATLEAAIYLLLYSDFLLANSYADVPIEGVEIELAHHGEPRTGTIVGGYADRTVVEPGDEVVVRLEVVPYRGRPTTRAITYELPEDLPAGRFSLIAGDGLSVDALRMALEPVTPIRIEQALRMLRSFHSRRDLVILGVSPRPGLSVAGEVMPRLPGSVQALWSAASSRAAKPLPLTVAEVRVESSEIPLHGAVRIDLEIERREPVETGEASDGSGSEEAGEKEEGGPGGETSESDQGEARAKGSEQAGDER